MSSSYPQLSVITDKNNLKGVINGMNYVYIPCKYKNIHLYFYERYNLILVQNVNNLWGIVDIGDELIAPYMFNKIDNIIIRDNYYLINNIIINKKGKILLYNRDKIYAI